MEHNVETFVEKLDRTLTDEQRELLLFLYKNLHVDELSEEEQSFFVEYFFNSETLRNMAVFAIALVEIIHEIEGNIPAIELEERLANSEEQRLYYERKWNDAKLNDLKHQTTKQGNVFHVPFAKYKKEPGPIIICLEQTKGMAKYTEICKSMVLPLFVTAHREHRDLYIVPYNNLVHGHYRFEKGRLNLSYFTDFIECDVASEAAIIPVLQFVEGLLQKKQQCTDADIIIFTEGVPIDGRRLVEPSVKTMMQEMIHKYHIDVSVIAMQENNFKEQYFWFADKVFFAEDAIF
ncbi:hypothetical protein AEA09_05485 [Lysinibacillus contaminans]|uniref:Uncharacterized protein n=1 Tax=Lysinibacillus contaminans TaxID=1293441 RepID=A0ABR5JZG9_9BACI|nr:hypothetical protein [Lysinibacillus contaminans]KOS68058.1 hypothetical protein AEA09_05485 [Lysinibacillus contaminans]